MVEIKGILHTAQVCLLLFETPNPIFLLYVSCHSNAASTALQTTLEHEPLHSNSGFLKFKKIQKKISPAIF